MTRPAFPRHRRNDWSFPADGSMVDLRRALPTSRPVQVPALPQRLTLDLARTAVLVVDLQNDFCHPDGWLAGIGVDVSGGAAAVAAVAGLLPRLRAAAVPVVWVGWGNRPDQANLPPGVRHVYDPHGRGLGIGSGHSPAGAPVLEAGSWGAALVDGLEPAPEDLLVDKYRMSGFVDTALDSILRQLRVDTLLLAGVNTDQCVYATLVDAANLGYDTVLLEEACATTSPDFCTEATLYNVRQCFGFTASVGDLESALAVS